MKIKKLSESGSQPHLLMIDRYVMGTMIFRFVLNIQICVCICMFSQCLDLILIWITYNSCGSINAFYWIERAVSSANSASGRLSLIPLNKMIL